MCLWASYSASLNIGFFLHKLLQGLNELTLAKNLAPGKCLFKVCCSSYYFVFTSKFKMCLSSPELLGMKNQIVHKITCISKSCDFLHLRCTFFARHSWEGVPGGSVDKQFACNAGDLNLIPRSERSPGEGHGNPCQYSCLENPMDRGAWWATVPRVAKSWTWLSDDLYIWKWWCTRNLLKPPRSEDLVPWHWCRAFHSFLDSLRLFFWINHTK